MVLDLFDSQEPTKICFLRVQSCVAVPRGLSILNLSNHRILGARPVVRAVRYILFIGS